MGRMFSAPEPPTKIRYVHPIELQDDNARKRRLAQNLLEFVERVNKTKNATSAELEALPKVARVLKEMLE